MTTTGPETAQQSPYYQVSFERLAELKRSPIALMAERRPLSCPSREVPDHELTDPQALVNEIAEHHGEDEGFISSDMPVQEIVFRALLTRRNEPTRLRELHYELTERWSTPVRPITFTERALARILDADTYYGFARSAPGG
jgi:hypothetical protein